MSSRHGIITKESSCVMTDSISESSESSTSSANSCEGSTTDTGAGSADVMSSSEIAPSAGEDNPSVRLGAIALSFDFRRRNVGDSFREE